MGHSKMDRPNVANPLLRRIANSRAGVLWSMVVLVIGCAVLAAAVRAYNHGAISSVNATRPPMGLPLLQGGGKPGRDVHGRLSRQPEANKLRRQLGQRFTKPGRERATLVGTLTIGVQQRQVQIVRTQTDDGEQVEITLGGVASLSWNALAGAKSAGSSATGIERSLIERLALDSPDQFVLAQLRGASYYTVAQQVMPEGIAPDEYNGPVWDVVRIGERTGSAGAKPESLYRLYYINVSTGLIEKIFSNEEGRSVVAELSGWTQVGGEWVAARTIWRIDNQAAMELNLTNVAHGPQQ